MKLIFLPKCTTSCLQPLDASVFRAFIYKYRKLFMKYEVSWVDEGKKRLQKRQDVNIAKAIHWLQEAWKYVSTDTIVHWFQKFGFKYSNSTCKDSEVDKEFGTLLNQLRDDDDITVEDFIMFDDNVTKYPGQINTDLVDSKEKPWEDVVQSRGHFWWWRAWGYSSFRIYKITGVATSGGVAWYLNN